MSPARREQDRALEEIEERLALLARLARKHGGGIADVLAHADHCRARRAELEQADQALEQAAHELAPARDELNKLAGQARWLAAQGRTQAGRRAVRARLGELAMPDAQFEIELAPRPDGCGPRGAETIEMMIAPNPGAPPGPAARGRLGRRAVARDAGAVERRASRAGSEPAEAAPLLVFDEIDAGIGGHTARAVGEHLRRAVAQARQVLCITHLPQVAALAQRHFTIAKRRRFRAATTTVATLDGDEVVGELVRMLGAGSDDGAAGQHARELLRAA